MTGSLRAQRMAHNESAFREYNSSVLRGIEEANQVAAEENESPIVIDRTMLLHFVCECADENCRARILLSLDEYEEAHKSNDHFTLACGHNVPGIEDVISSSDRYCVVKKHDQPPRHSSGLKKTDT